MGESYFSIVTTSDVFSLWNRNSETQQIILKGITFSLKSGSKIVVCNCDIFFAVI